MEAVGGARFGGIWVCVTGRGRSWCFRCVRIDWCGSVFVLLARSMGTVGFHIVVA